MLDIKLVKENVSYDYAEFNCFKLNISQYGGVPYIWWTVYLIYFVGMKLSAVSVLMMMYINIWVKWILLCKCTFYVFPFDNKKIVRKQIIFQTALACIHFIMHGFVDVHEGVTIRVRFGPIQRSLCLKVAFLFYDDIM